MFGIKGDKVRERLLQESGLTLHKTDEICRAAESMVAQIKVVSDTSKTTINAVKSGHNITSSRNQSIAKNKLLQECWNCGRTHQYHKKELCPAYSKTCNGCQKLNHFAVKCRSKVRGTQRDVKALDRDDPDDRSLHSVLG